MGKLTEALRNYQYGGHCIQGSCECDRAAEAAGAQQMPSTQDMGSLKPMSDGGGSGGARSPEPAQKLTSPL